MVMRRKRRRVIEEDVGQPPMTPMIDVIFQLLVYFMVTLHFKELEGTLLSRLPKNKGPAPDVSSVIVNEVRIYICAGGDIQQHSGNKGEHEKIEKPSVECLVYVEKNPIGTLYKTEERPSSARDNEDIYKALAVKTREIYETLPPPQDPRFPNMVVLDADSEVPYEHIIGAVNACKRAGLGRMEFVGNPRFDKYYGSFQKGQFNRR